MQVPTLPRVSHAYPLPLSVFHDPRGRPVRLSWAKQARQVTGAPQRLSDRRETPLWGRPTGLSRNPLGQPARAHAGRTFCDLRTSCGDTNSITLHVARQVCGIQNPQSCRQAHRKSHISGAPIFSIAYPTSSIEKQSGNKTAP